MQEKKVKKISEMNVHAAEGVQNGSNASSSTAAPRGYLPNGGCSEKVYNQLSNELSSPFGGFEEREVPGSRSFFTEIIASISDQDVI
ncbi:hypothetical protein Cni_G13666 [Canna indica]|uniref:Uncharacterized protein n=1 Tax=Canna indica TaxID=4628 RepID=A0AAQ3KD15_9LILI|nr:hypothetical protein Cni_G13666 [Canna indica]